MCEYGARTEIFGIETSAGWRVRKFLPKVLLGEHSKQTDRACQQPFSDICQPMTGAKDLLIFCRFIARPTEYAICMSGRGDDKIGVRVKRQKWRRASRVLRSVVDRLRRLRDFHSSPLLLRKWLPSTLHARMYDASRR